MIAVWKRELRIFFCTPTGYIYIAVLLAAGGTYMVSLNLLQAYSSFAYVIDYLCFLYVILIPILTMRVFVEERRQQTDTLLYALPLDSAEIVLGKYLALATVNLLPVLVMCLYPLILTRYGIVDLRTAYSALSAFYLLGCALCAAGMYFSSLTDSYIVAAVLSFAVFFLSFRVSSIQELLPRTALFSYLGISTLILLLGLYALRLTRNLLFSLVIMAVLELPLTLVFRVRLLWLAGTFNQMLDWFAIFHRVQPFIAGEFDLAGVIYFLSVTVLFLSLTVRVLERRRWS